jgi:glucokinase
MTRTIFTWDLGATKCAAGIIEYQPDTQQLTCKKHCAIKLSDAQSLEELTAQLESQLGMNMHDADAICIGAAGHYDGESLLLEKGYPYPMTFASLAKQKVWPSFAVIHDYAPIVCSTFTTYMDDTRNIKRLNNATMNPYGRRVALGVGTGLGLKDGVLLPNGDFWLGKNEMGHIGITTPPHADAFYTKRHQALMQFLTHTAPNEKNPAITFEKILSGSGMVRLYQFFHPEATDMTPEIVGAKLQAGESTEVADTFAWYLGLFVGTVQLSFMPEGGIWITGGVALNHLHVFDKPDFMNGVYAAPTYQTQREEYPLGVLCNTEHALIGSGFYATKRLLSL